MTFKKYYTIYIHRYTQFLYEIIRISTWFSICKLISACTPTFKLLSPPHRQFQSEVTVQSYLWVLAMSSLFGPPSSMLLPNTKGLSETGMADPLSSILSHRIPRGQKTLPPWTSSLVVYCDSNALITFLSRSFSTACYHGSLDPVFSSS